jgi:hypothetical protein
MPKMQTYTSAMSLNDNYIFLAEDGSSTNNPTVKISLSLLKSFFGGTEINNWTASTVYVVNDIVINSNNLYKCITNHTSGETFDITNWNCISTGTLTSISWEDVLSKPFNTLGTDLSVTDNVLSVAKVNGHTVETDVPTGAIFTDTTYSVFTATVNGLVPFPTTSNGYFLKDDGTWAIAQGEKGDNAYVWIKYSAIQPTQDSDMSDTPNKYIGIYSGTATTAPSTYTSYTWYKYKGETGATGTAGSHIYTGIAITGTNTTPTAYNTNITYANVDDLYISTAAGSVDNLYKCTTAGNDSTALWAYMNSIKGEGAQIDDTVTSATAVWSSNKVNDELANKQNKVTVSNTYTLTVAGWDSTAKTQTVNMTLNTNNIYEIIPDLSCRDTIGNCKVEPSAEATTGITFSCNTIPASDITFKMAITEVQV